MKSIKGNQKSIALDTFWSMVESDIEWFFKLLPFCKKAKVLLIAGSISSSKRRLYLSEFIERYAPKYGFELIGNINALRKIPGRGKSDFYKLRGKSFTPRTVFFCGSSPSDPNKPPFGKENSSWLVLRVKDNQPRLITSLGEQG